MWLMFGFIIIATKLIREKMSSQENKIDWNLLCTVESFDTGSKDSDEMCDSTQVIGGELMKRVIPTITTPISLLVQSLIQQLCTMLEKDHKRATKLYDSICEKLHQMKLIDETYSMGEFEIMRCQYQVALQQLVRVASGPELPAVNHSVWPIPPSSELEWSRYHREFEEILFIANGGFGKVFKARHRLDGVEYAVKKVFIRSRDLNSVLHHLAEVKTFASLDHPNIVSYKSAWLEPLVESQKTNDCEGSTGSDELAKGTSTNYNNNSSSSYLSNHVDDNCKSCTDDSDIQICFEGESKKIETIEEYDSWRQNMSMSETSEKCKILCKLGNNRKVLNCHVEASQINLKWATLFIQMSLCQKTLKTWLEERNLFTATTLDSPILISENQSNWEDPTPSTNRPLDGQYPSGSSYIDAVIDIFTQLTNGLHYIHHRGIIHHDVKPSNIFIGYFGTARSVRLGDFGLACPLQKSHNGVALGTRLYAAPEQLEGECNMKSDLYSIGIILLEMMETFGTEMEKVETLKELRNGHIPAHVTANYPKLAHIIGKLVQIKPSKRIDTSQLLELLEGLNENKDDTIKVLREELGNLRQELTAKEDQINAKDVEIARLKLLLENKHVK